MSVAAVHTAHPLSWTKADLTVLNIHIENADPELPVVRDLDSTTLREFKIPPASGPAMPDEAELVQFFGECLTADGIKTSDNKSLQITSSMHPLKLKRSTGDVHVAAQGKYSLGGNVFIACISRAWMSRERSESNLQDIPDDNIACYMAILIALAQRAARKLGPTHVSYPVQLAYPSDDCTQFIVLTAVIPVKFLRRFKNGREQPDTLKVCRTMIPVGDGTSIANFAKQAIESAPQPAKNRRGEFTAIENHYFSLPTKEELAAIPRNKGHRQLIWMIE